MEAAKEAAFAANIGVGGDLTNLLSEDNPDGVVMITEDGKITFVNKVQTFVIQANPHNRKTHTIA